MNLRRSLYLTHRWLGIGMCLLVAMWFSSGVVMMYVGFPELTRSERISGLPTLEATTIQYGPDKLLREVSAASAIGQLRLTAVLGRPAYLLRTENGTTRGLFADTGAAFAGSDTKDALQAASVYATAAGIDSPGVTYLRQLEMDQWSVSSSLNAHRPLHLVALNDSAVTHLYISGLTGEVVRDTTREERVWNWLGSNLHWIYPVQLRRHPTIWHWVVVVLSLVGLVSIISGAIIGFIRLRLRKPYRGRDVTPYQGSMKLHHILGLLSLIPLTTFMFSGLMSMNPWSVFSDDVSFREHHDAYRGKPIAADAIRHIDSAGTLRRALQKHPESREVIWQWFDEKPYHYAVLADGERQLLSHPLRDDTNSVHAYWEEHGVRKLREVMSAYRIEATERLDTYDSYYYSHRERWRPLPVLRVRFSDPANTWFHLDLDTGEIRSRLTTTGRVQRWLYNGLHSLDFTFLIYRRPAWDLVVIALSLAGFVFSVTAVTIGWRRLRRKAGRRGRT